MTAPYPPEQRTQSALNDAFFLIASPCRDEEAYRKGTEPPWVALMSVFVIAGVWCMVMTAPAGLRLLAGRGDHPRMLCAGQ